MSEPTRDHQPTTATVDPTVRACVAAVREARTLGMPVGESVAALLDHVKWSKLTEHELELVLALVIGAQDAATKREIRAHARNERVRAGVARARAGGGVMLKPEDFTRWSELGARIAAASPAKATEVLEALEQLAEACEQLAINPLNRDRWHRENAGAACGREVEHHRRAGRSPRKHVRRFARALRLWQVDALEFEADRASGARPARRLGRAADRRCRVTARAREKGVG